MHIQWGFYRICPTLIREFPRRPKFECSQLSWTFEPLKTDQTREKIDSNIHNAFNTLYIISRTLSQCVEYLEVLDKQLTQVCNVISQLPSDIITSQEHQKIKSREKLAVSIEKINCIHDLTILLLDGTPKRCFLSSSQYPVSCLLTLQLCSNDFWWDGLCQGVASITEVAFSVSITVKTTIIWLCVKFH